MIKTLSKKIFVSSWFPPILLFIIFVSILELMTSGFGLISEYIIPSPSSIVKATIDFLKMRTGDYFSTISNTVAGYLIALPLSFLIAALLAQSKITIKATSPLIVVLAVTPMLVLLPILLVWTKYASYIKMLAVVLQASPIIVMNVLSGFINVSKDNEELAKVYGLSKTKRFIKIVVPQALPTIFTGMRLGIIMAALGIISIEFLLYSIGIGYRITVSTNFLNIPLTYGCIVLLAITSYGLMTLVTFIEGKIVV